MAYDLSKQCCGTCIYWTGHRTFGAFDTVDFSCNEAAPCAAPSVAIVAGGYGATTGSYCSFYKGVKKQ